MTLEEFIREVEQRNPEIAAAQQGYLAATHVAGQVSAFPDTQVMVQHFGVGGPRPFAGYSNSEFAYIGLVASQEIPYPGKRQLRAKPPTGSGSAAVQADSSRRGVVDQLKATYFRLAYLQETLEFSSAMTNCFESVQEDPESRYSVGQGNQQEVLKAQLQHTKILQEITHAPSRSRADAGPIETTVEPRSGVRGHPDHATDPPPNSIHDFAIDGPRQTQNPDIQAQQQMGSK